MKAKTSSFVRCGKFGGYIKPVTIAEAIDRDLYNRLPAGSDKIVQEITICGEFLYFRRKKK